MFRGPGGFGWYRCCLSAWPAVGRWISRCRATCFYGMLEGYDFISHWDVGDWSEYLVFLAAEVPAVCLGKLVHRHCSMVGFTSPGLLTLLS